MALRRVVSVAALLPALIGVAPARGIEIEYARFKDPEIDPPRPVLGVSPASLPLWLQALEASEMDLRREAADTLVEAYRQGLSEAKQAEPALLKALAAPGQHPLVVAAVARALIALDCRHAADSLWAHAQRGSSELAQVIEPALAQWDYRPARSVWLQRLANRETPRGLLFLAIEGLANVGEQSAVPTLKALAVDRTGDAAVRLAAARAVGRLTSAGQESDARRLAADRTPQGLTDRLVAAWLLRRHSASSALAVLEDLAQDPEPAVAAVALQRLLEADFARIVRLSDKLLASPDARVRQLTAQAWVAERTPQAVSQLGVVLDDPHPGIRAHVRESLLDMASQPALRPAVLEAARRQLAGRSWRGLEQAVMILVALEQKDIADRLVELLDFERPEVFVAAAWGLRRLAVPATSQRVLTKLEKLRDLQMVDRSTAEQDRQFSHLAEMLGLLRVGEAEPLLRQYVPKNIVLSPSVRGAAIWALGHIRADKPEPELARQLAERVADVMGILPEAAEVRAMSAIALGRMKAREALPVLRKFSGGPTVAEATQYACGWAIHCITGEPMPTFITPVLKRRGWFLERLE